ncbi:MAG: prolyl oligopeptidase family serine peptidase [Planctomycetes bacterium]|nr:prolyl oligopeptidase family serine peptidase [Planctomycetota bacterium]
MNPMRNHPGGPGGIGHRGTEAPRLFLWILCVSVPLWPFPSVFSQDVKSFEEDLRTLEGKSADADVQVYAKGAAWALRAEANLPPKDAALVRKALDRGLARAGDADRAWTKRKGKVIRGYRSAIDDSVQPYGVIVPASYDAAKPTRLDVVLHGSQQPAGMSELRFIERFDDDASKAPEQDFIEMHPLGRVENGYRYAGETDVFEAIEAACRSYSIDRSRIVLRGMSMGASGTWHLGLKRPDRFVALGPYCGYVDTHKFSETPIKTFVKVGPLPDYQEKTLTTLDSIDYAANAGVVPAIAAIGDKDVFWDCHVIMGRAMEQEGLKMVNLISPGTGHVIDPATHKEQMRRIGEHAAKGLDPAPKELRFVTWTLKYNRCFWIEILALKEHYARAEVKARIDGEVVVIEAATNIRRLAVHFPAAKIRAGRTEIAAKASTVIEERDGVWRLAEGADEGKRPGLQGPLDDAFGSPFLCVRGTGQPWNPAVQAWADASLKRFAEEWRVWFRGELPVKDDAKVTEEDLKARHLVLFGDPGSNPWILKALPKLPLSWTRDEVSLRGKKYAAAEHAPVLICASPLAENRYLVLNSGHTFHPPELKINYLFFPRLGDWAVMKLADGSPVDAGLFDEHWK